MEKRLVLFLVLSVFILTGHLLIRSMLFPPQQIAQQGDDLQPAEKDQTEAGKKDAAEPKQGKQTPKTPNGKKEVEENGQVAEDPKEAQDEPDAKEAAPPEFPLRWLTLGSYDPSSGCRLLITFISRGGAVERVELVERDSKGRLRYRDLLLTYGYLGLDAHDKKQGCVVKVVRPGTPADMATPSDSKLTRGLSAGDVVISANGMRIGSRAELEAFLEQTEPGEETTFEVLRDGAKVALTAELDHWPLQLIQPETPTPVDLNLESALLQLDTTDDDEMISSYLLGLNSVGSNARSRGQEEVDGLTSLKHSNWEVVESDERAIVFSRRVQLPEADGGGELEFLKRYEMVALADPNEGPQTKDETAAQNPNAAYHLQMNIEIRNHGTSPQTVSYVMDGPNGLPLEGWWYTNKIHTSWGSAGARDVVRRVHGAKHSLRSATQIYKQAQEAQEENDPDKAIMSVLTDSASPEERTLDYLGVDTQYFSAVLLAGTLAEPIAFTCQEAKSLPVGEVPELSGRGTKKLNTSYRMVSVPVSIEPGASITDQYHVFLGPKSTDVLADYDLADIIEYGWFGKIARPLSWLLHVFYGVFRNYGLSIVLLTVLVRGAMFPIGRKAARNAQMMQELAPEIKKIKEKYKNDLEKQGQAQRELWKKHNFNPLSGCWLMFLQLPIFIGLYRCLSVDIHLRQAPLIPGLNWCSNLAGPDMVWRWQGILPDFLVAETGWLGPYLNILPIITIVLFIAQQKMFTPPATDDQTRMQQSMMKYMMIFMGVLFFKVPAGLCVYFVASSLWGIGERKLLPKPKAVKQEPAPQTAKQPSPAKSKKTPVVEKKSWFERLKEKADAEASDAARRRHKRRK